MVAVDVGLHHSSISRVLSGKKRGTAGGKGRKVANYQRFPSELRTRVGIGKRGRSGKSGFSLCWLLLYSLRVLFPYFGDVWHWIEYGRQIGCVQPTHPLAFLFFIPSSPFALIRWKIHPRILWSRFLAVFCGNPPPDLGLLGHSGI